MATPPAKTMVKAKRPVKSGGASTKSLPSKTTVKARKPVKRIVDSENAMAADMERSGLDAVDMKRLGVKNLNGAATARVTNDKFHVASYAIPYYDAQGKDTNFLRLRFLQEVKLPGETKPIRYWQPPGTLPRAYFPRVGAVKWDKIVKDVDKPIYITEGEKKAAVACKHGLACIGLGGVWSWRSSKFGKALLSDLEDISWEGREVVIVFDSDLNDNPNVQAALTQMGRTLLEHGAVVSNVRLTALDNGDKAGLDDFILHRGVSAFHDLEIEPLQDSVELWRLNEEVALIRKSGGVMELDTHNLYSKSSFCETVYANRRFVRVTGEGKLREVSAPEEWVKWPHRREYADVTYTPGAPQVTERNELNLWEGWGCEPKQGDVKPFLDVLRYVLRGNEEQMEWLLRWMAYPIKHPGTKLYSSVLIWGSTHGTGKSLLGYMLGKLYGKNFNAIGQEDLESSFNDWAARKQLILGEEVTSSDKRKDTDRLKYMTTRKSVTINVKYQPTYDIPDYTNYFFTSNHPDAFFVEPTDRRLFIAEAPKTPGPQAMYDAADKWMESEDGPAALMYYLLHSVDLRNFNPKSHAMDTASKQEMISLSASDLDTFARELLTDPATVLGPMGARGKRGDLYTSEELMELFDPGGTKRTTKIALSKALRRAGIAALPVTTTSFGSRTLFPVRNTEEWEAALHHERAEHYEMSLGKASARPGPSKIEKKVTPITNARKKK